MPVPSLLTFDNSLPGNLRVSALKVDVLEILISLTLLSRGFGLV